MVVFTAIPAILRQFLAQTPMEGTLELRAYEKKSADGFIRFDYSNFAEIERLVELQLVPIVEQFPVFDDIIAKQVRGLVADPGTRWGWLERETPHEAFHIGWQDPQGDGQSAREVAKLALRPKLLAVQLGAELADFETSTPNHARGLRALAAAQAIPSGQAFGIRQSPFGKLSRHYYLPRISNEDDMYGSVENIARLYLNIRNLYCLTVLSPGDHRQ
jgi:hypothetical protein